MGRKKHSKNQGRKIMGKPTLPPNETYWLCVAKNKSDIEAFAARGNERQKKYLQQIINYKLWQIEHGDIPENYFEVLDVDLGKLDIKIKAPTIKKKKKLYNGDAITPEEKKAKKKIINLYDFSNIEDLTKDK